MLSPVDQECFFFFIFFFIIHLFYIVWREGQGRYELLTMVGAGGTRTCVHPHVSPPLYYCAMDADQEWLVGRDTAPTQSIEDYN